MSCSIAAVFFYARYTPRLTFTIPRRTLDDLGNCGSLRRIVTAFYPLVISDLRILGLVWIRERFASGGGLRTATTLDVCALNCGETGIDSQIDTGLAVAALGVPGRGRLPATSHIVQRACSLPTGEIGVTASGYSLSQIALVIASGHAPDYLPLLPARGQESQDGWPDVKHRRVLRRLSLSLLLFLKCRWQFLLRLEALFFIVTSVCSAGSCQVLFLCLSRSSSLGAICGIAGGAAPSARSGFRCALRLLQLVLSLLVLRLRCLLELVICPLLCLAYLVLCSDRWISPLVGVSVARPVVGSTGESCHRWRFPSPVASSRRPGSSAGLPRFFEVLDQVFLPPTSGRSFIGGASAWFCLLLRLTAVSLACGLAFAVFCGSGGFPCGY